MSVHPTFSHSYHQLQPTLSLLPTVTSLSNSHATSTSPQVSDLGKTFEMSTSSSTREFADGFSCVIFKDNNPETVTDTTDDQIIEQPKPKKKKNRGVKKGKGSKTKLSATTDTDSQAAGATAVQVHDDNTAVPAAPPLSKTAKNKLRAQNKAAKEAKTARAAQIAAAAKAKKMGVSVITDENASAPIAATLAITDSEDISATESLEVAEDVPAEVTASSTSDDGEVIEATESSSDDSGASSFGDVDASSVPEDASSTAAASSPPPDAADSNDTPGSASVAEDVVSASGDVDEPSKSSPFDSSEDATFGFGNNVTFDFGHDSSFETGNVAISGVLQPINITEALLKFGQAFSPMPPAPRRVLSLETGDTASSGSNSSVGATPMPPKVRKATSFASSVRKHQAQQGKPSILDGSKAPRDMVPVKLNRKPLLDFAKKDHQEPNPFLQTLIKKSSINPVCAEAAFNLQTKFGATIPRKPLKKASKPVAIEYYAPVNGDSAGKVDEIDDVQDEDMPDAISITDAEDTADEAVTSRITEIEDASIGVDDVEPVINTADSAPTLVKQADGIISEDIESLQSEDEQSDGFVVQDAIEIEEQASQGNVDEDIIKEQVTAPPSSAPLPAEEIVVKTPLVNNTASILVANSQLDFLSFPNAAEYLPALSSDTVQALIDVHVTPLYLQELPGAVKKVTRAEKKAAKIASAVQVVDSPPAAVSKSELNFLSFLDAAEYPAVLSRNEAQVVFDLHVTPLRLQQVPGNVVKPAAAENKAARKAAKAAAKAEKKALAKQAAVGTFDAPAESSTEPTDAAQQPTTLPIVEQGTAETADGVKIIDSTPEASTEPTELSSVEQDTAEASNVVEIPEPVQELSIVPTELAPEEQVTPEGADAADSTSTTVIEATALPVQDNGSEHGSDPSSQSSPDADDSSPGQSDDAASPDGISESSSASPSTQERVIVEMNHTFLGITSLSKFVAVLPKSSGFTVTKDALCSTFGEFATIECRILLGHVPTYMDGRYDTVGAQCKAMLGNTSLYEFLQALEWTDDITSLKDVMRVFKEKAAEGEAFDAQMQPIANGVATGQI